MNKLLSTKEVAEILGVEVQTIRKWRMDGSSPKYLRYGKLKGRCMYRQEDIQSWIEEKLRISTSEETVLTK
jgi:excisionase family DNA binding protein